MRASLLNALAGLLLALALLLAASPASAFYPKNGDVVELSEMQSVLKDSAVWLVEFYAPWCGHCKSAKGDFEKAAAALKGIAKVGAVDMTKHQSLGTPYGVQGFPTFKIFVGGKAQDYNGARSAAAFVDAVTNAIKAHAKARLGGGSSGGQQQQSKKSSSSSGSGSGSGNPVEQLSDSNFDDIVYGSDDMFIVAFVADYCGWCKKLKPEYLAAAKKLHGSGIRFAQVEAPENPQLSQRFGIQGFPTLKVFGPGPKSDSKVISYEGEREENAIIEFAQSTFERLGGQVKFEIPELVDQSILDKTCTKEKRCVIVFLEDLLDTTAAKRTAQIETIKATARKARHMPFIWASANSQPKWEEAFQLSFGFPAVLMLREGPNGERVGFIHRGKFTEADLHAFITAPRALSSGISVKWPPVEKVKEPWDGKSEAKKIVEEDDGFKLEDFLKDEV